MASWSERVRNPIVIALAAMLAGAVVFLVLGRIEGRPALEIAVGGTTPEAGGPIEVYITGAVAQPGVYEAQDGDRVIDILFEAGGFAPDADPEAINLARRLHDEDQIVVPRLGQEPADVAGVAAGTVNINTATAEELRALPGIGEAYSESIIDSRTSDGPFGTTEDLADRRVIPRATYERIRDLITAGP